MTVATLVWWATVAGEAPAALTGGSRMAHASPLVPALVLAAVLMLVATSLAGLGANRAMSAHREL
jgi:multisubunit Na+/H+ antiporter MnhC subunit